MRIYMDAEMRVLISVFLAIAPKLSTLKR